MSDSTPTPAAAPEPHPSPAPAAPPEHEDLVRRALADLIERREALLAEIRDIEARRDRIRTEATSDFAGQSDAIARRLKGFQDYLVGALQDLAAAAEQIELVARPLVVQPSPLDRTEEPAAPTTAEAAVASGGPFGADADLIRERLRRFQEQPDFSAEPWELRRSLAAAGAAVLENWFLEQGGRGAQPSAGSRSRNVLVTAAAIAILGAIYGDRFQTLVLAAQPERLGEWRRGLQDALGLSRDDFGPASGIVLFERADSLVERADRLEEREELPFIVIDAAERAIDIPVLQFPLWLAFAAAPGELDDDELAY
jgi:hypothetical protein